MRAFCRILLAGMALAVTAHGATITVTTTLDGPITDPQTQDSLCSLRVVTMPRAGSSPAVTAVRAFRIAR